MEHYLKNHENFIKETLAGEKPKTDWQKLAQNHQLKIGYFQHERLIHLLVTLFFGLALLISVFFTLVYPKIVMFGLDLLLIILLIPYLFHYRQLENGVQRLYKQTDEVWEKIEATNLPKK
jgi:hypothetical protein